MALSGAEEDPESYEDILGRPDYDKWVEAMSQEMKSMYKNNVWTLVDKPEGANTVSNKWIFVIKRKPDGSVDRYKARLVARGFSQVYGFDYHETYAPVAYMPTIRTLFAFAAARKLSIVGFDVKTAFFYAEWVKKFSCKNQKAISTIRPKYVYCRGAFTGLNKARGNGISVSRHSLHRLN